MTLHVYTIVLYIYVRYMRIDSVRSGFFFNLKPMYTPHYSRKKPTESYKFFGAPIFSKRRHLGSIHLKFLRQYILWRCTRNGTPRLFACAHRGLMRLHLSPTEQQPKTVAQSPAWAGSERNTCSFASKSRARACVASLSSRCDSYSVNSSSTSPNIMLTRTRHDDKKLFFGNNFVRFFFSYRGAESRSDCNGFKQRKNRPIESVRLRYTISSFVFVYNIIFDR